MVEHSSSIEVVVPHVERHAHLTFDQAIDLATNLARKHGHAVMSLDSVGYVAHARCESRRANGKVWWS